MCLLLGIFSMSRHKIFSLPTRVYFQDTDAGGVVYHGSYVNFMERARDERRCAMCAVLATAR